MANSTTELLESTFERVQTSIGPYSEALKFVAHTLNYYVILIKSVQANIGPRLSVTETLYSSFIRKSITKSTPMRDLKLLEYHSNILKLRPKK